MRPISLFVVAASAAALSACGSHTHAPVAYGTDPNSTGHIYNSPADYARAHKQAQPTYAARTAPSQVTPVTAATISQEELPPAPTYVSVSDPELLRRSNARAERVVTVQRGDTVYAISRRTGASPDAIIAENRLRAPYALEVGQSLRIPSPEKKIANTIAERAPVRTEVRASAPVNRTHVVRAGDTLYSISRSTGVSVNVLAQANNLRPPYALSVGQSLTVPGAEPVQTTTPRQREAAAPRNVENLTRSVSYTAPTPAPANEPARLFEWPLKGAIIGKYGDGIMGRRNDGVNIAAPVGTPVRAAAAGEVVYRGSELDGYGNLLLIKHDDGFVTAYAHNDVMLVKKGQRVNQGQMIAKVGQTGAASEPQLHFEIRQNLKSVDPLGFLDN